MVNYANGKIYKIECLSGNADDVYIGSTTKEYLSQRMDKHRSDYKVWKNGKRGKTLSFDVFDKYGIENCVITLLENVNAQSKNELQAREAHYIRTVNCVNKYIPLRTDKQYYQDNKDKLIDKSKQYYENNKENNRHILAERTHKYRQENKDKIAEREKKYRQDNKDKIAKRKKEYYEKNKQKVLEKNKERYLAKKSTNDERSRKTCLKNDPSN